MRRGKEKDVKEYIEIRIKQLEEDAYKCKVPHDRQWYNRLIQEMRWAISPHHNCFIKADEKKD